MTYFHQAFAVLPPRALFVALLKTHCFQQAYSSPSGSAKCLRIGYLPMHSKYCIWLLTYLLTYVLYSTGIQCIPWLLCLYLVGAACTQWKI